MTKDWPDYWRDVQAQYLPERDEITVTVTVDAAVLARANTTEAAAIDIARLAVAAAFSSVLEERDALRVEVAELKRARWTVCDGDGKDRA